MLLPLSATEKNRAGIYCLVCYPTGDMYVGSTNNLSERMKHHRHWARIKNKVPYPQIRELGIQNFCLEIIELWEGCPEEMVKREYELIQQLQPSLNSRGKKAPKSSPKYSRPRTAPNRKEASTTTLVTIDYSYEEYRRLTA